jgi:hypothetical protein
VGRENRLLEIDCLIEYRAEGKASDLAVRIQVRLYMEELTFKSHHEVSEPSKKAMGSGFTFIHVRSSRSGQMAFSSTSLLEDLPVQFQGST